MAGLASSRPALLWWGVMVVIVTPVAGSVVIAVQLLRERDWVFATVALLILAVLASSALAGFRLARSSGTPGARTGAPARSGR